MNRLLHAQDWSPLITGCNAIVNCAGILQSRRGRSVARIHDQAPRALFDAARAAGIDKVVQISAVSVGAGDQVFQPIVRGDLARLVVLAVETDRLDRSVLEPCGPEQLTMADIVERLRGWLGLPPAALLRVTGLLRLVLVAGYTLLLTVAAPALWLEPLGPLLKNLPILALIVLGGHDWTEFWLLAAYGLYIVAAACWLPVVWIQIELRRKAGEAARQAQPLPPRYHRFMRIWFTLGRPAFLAMLVLFALMVFKPDWT